MSNINEMNVGPRWYVVHTFSGYENKIKTSLERAIENKGLGDLFFDIKIPVEITIEKSVKDGVEVEKEVEVKLFPSYIFIKMVMNDDTWHAVRNIQGVTGFVGPGSRPTPLPKEEVRAMRLEDDGTAKGEDNKRVTLAFAVGDTVMVSSGLFEGYTGTVQAISDDQTQVTLLIKKGRRDMPVEIEASCLVPQNA